MIQPQKKEIMDVLYVKEPAQRTFTQNFEYSNRIITHEHRVEVQNTLSRTLQPQIRNHFAKINGETLVKLTEIQFQNRIIKIIDCFTAPVLCQTYIDSYEVVSDSSKNSNRKQLLPKRFQSVNDQQLKEKEFKLRDTKNVVKNIIRLFQGWLQEDIANRGLILEALCDMIKVGKFNNSLIINISAFPLLRRAFLRFIESQAQNCITKSKIHDKQSHLEALRKYQNLCIQQQEQDEQLRGRNEVCLNHQMKECVKSMQ